MTREQELIAKKIEAIRKFQTDGESACVIFPHKAEGIGVSIALSAEEQEEYNKAWERCFKEIN